MEQIAEESKIIQEESKIPEAADSGGEEENSQEQAEKIKQILGFSDIEKETFRNMYPSRNLFTFPNGIQISSNYDGGNLLKCFEAQASKKFPCDKIFNKVNEKLETYYCFEMHVCPDSWPYLSETSTGKAGFFFDVSGIPEASKKFDEDLKCEVQEPRTLRIHFKNLSNQAKLLSYGHMPVYLEVSHQDYLKLIKGQLPFYRQKWRRVTGEMDYVKGEEGLEAVFHYQVKTNFKKDDHVFLAYIYPYTFQDMEYSIKEVQQKFTSDSSMFFERKVLVNSLEGRPMHQFTISSQKAVQEDSPIIFFTCRVHCGESPGSYMLQGVLDKLMNFENPQTKVLLDNYVFKIIPMLNPDGVSRGYWRFDTLGLNLNRFYKDPTEEAHPTIWAAKNAILDLKANLKMYVDFHAHCTKKGFFIFGNTLTNPDLQYEAMMIPKLMSLNSVNFDFRQCNFQDEKNNIKDKKGDSRDGSGRAVMFRETNSNPFVYTFEANYATGHRINTLSCRFDLSQDKKLIKEESQIHDTTSSLYSGGKIPIYTPDIYFDVGQSLLLAVLDYDLINPVTRLIKKKGDTLEEAVNKIRAELRKQDEKPSMQSIKKKLGVGKKKKAPKVDKFEMLVEEEKIVEKFEKLKV